jgi:hypothetical protein
LLSQAGREVELRNVAEDRYARELVALGFDTIPIVVIDGVAAPAWIEASLRRTLGLPQTELPEGGPVAYVESAIRSLDALLSIMPQIPDRLWAREVVPNRDRLFGQWVWHILRTAEATMDMAETRRFDIADAKEISEGAHWRRRAEFATFSAIAAYGGRVVARLREWAKQDLSDAAEDSRMIWDTPFGAVRLSERLQGLDRSMAVHLKQVIARMEQWEPAFRPPPQEVMDKIALYPLPLAGD